MATHDRAAIVVYVSYMFQAVGLAISWLFATYFVKHELGAVDFITLVMIWSVPAFIVMGSVNLWGSLSDRLKKRKPFMLLGFAGYGITFLAYSFTENALQYFIIAIIGSFFYSAALPMAQAQLTTGTEKKGERLGYLLAFQSAGWLIGGLVSGWAYEIIGMFMLYRIAALLCFVATVVCFVFVSEVPFGEREGRTNRGFRHLIRKPGMTRLTAAVASSQIGINAIAFLFAIFIIDELHGAPILVGLANSGATAIAVLITGYIGILVDRRGPVRILIVSFVAYAIFGLGFALVRDPILAALMWAFPIYPLSSTAAFALGSHLSDEDERGKAMALVSGAQNFGGAVGPIVGGVFAQFIFHAVQPISWLNIVFNIIAIVIIASLLRTVKENRGKEEESKDLTPSETTLL